MTPDPLAQLRDYHLPEPVSWWPPAPGWWLLALIALLALVWLALFLRRHLQLRAARRLALRELKALEQAFEHKPDATTLLRELSRLLRRFALARFPREQVAGLSGADWLAFLDRQHPGLGFLDGPGRRLLDAPYRPAAAAEDLPELIGLVRRWIARNPGGPQ
jgi:hypothetical protein